MTTPTRIQRRRTRGWKMPPDTVSVTRPGEFGNPFLVGGYFKISERAGGAVWMVWSQRIIWQPSDEQGALRDGYTLIETPAMAVEWFERYITLFPKDLSKLRGKSLACWCKVGQPCHGDVLLRLANVP